MLKQIRWYMEIALFWAISFAVALLPLRVALALGRGIGRLAFALMKRRRLIAIDNISASLPFLERQPGWQGGTPYDIARETFENLGRSVVEICKIYHGRGRDLIDAIEFRGVEHFEQARAKGKGVAFITAHCGNWELLALAFGARQHESLGVARRLDNPYLNRMVERIRESYGNRVIYKAGALRAMFAELRTNGVVGFLIDQAASPNLGVLVDFLGRPAWTTRVPALIGRRGGAPMLPVFIHREGETQVATIHPEYLPSCSTDPETCAAEDAAGLTRYIEQYIVAHPAQWYWIHNRWKRAAVAGPAGREGAAQPPEEKPQS